MHMIINKDLNSAEIDTLTKSCSPRRMKRPQFISKNWKYSWQWKSSRIRQQSYRSESFAMKRNILMSGSTVKNHISFKTGFEYNVIQRTSFRLWFQACHRALLQACLAQHSWHLQGRKLIILRLPQARLPHQPSHLQLCQAKVWLDKNGETRVGIDSYPAAVSSKERTGRLVDQANKKSNCWLSQPKIQNQIKMWITIKNGETRAIPTYHVTVLTRYRPIVLELI